jgi:tetratricopeptide (TPR) repeat protein
MKVSAHSPLELYEQAYRLHYQDGKKPEACRIYKALIEEFPDSNECGYAVIQLEKILAENVSERINVSSRTAIIFAVVALAVALVALGGSFFAGSMYVKTINEKMNVVSLLNQAQAYIAIGNTSEAITLLEQAKQKSAPDAAVYMLSGIAYAKSSQIEKAMEDFSKANKLSGIKIPQKSDLEKAFSVEHKVQEQPVLEKADSLSPEKAQTVKVVPVFKQAKGKTKKDSARFLKNQ